MSHHSDDQLLQAGSDSFWEPNNYKRTTKRIEDGYRLCSDLQTLIAERAEIEKAYAKNLRLWSKKWGELIEKGPEYGTMEAAWKGILTEAERLADVHLKVKENLIAGEVQQIRTWQKDNYQKTMIHIKQRKDMEEQFKKAQKPWAKHLAKVDKTKADYHAACKTEKTATNQERNANADSSLSPDQIKKMQDRVQKTKDEVQKAAEKYEQSLQEINKYNPIYMEDMTSVFIKCQEMEETRLRFFKNVLFAIHKSLNFSKDPQLPQIYEEFYHTINNADHQKDLKWWSNNHGVNMAMKWPSFAEYTEEFRDIAKGNKAKDPLPTAPITLIHQRPVGEELPEYPPAGATNGGSKASNTNNINSTVTSSHISINRMSSTVSITNSTNNNAQNNSNISNATTASAGSTTTTATATATAAGARNSSAASRHTSQSNTAVADSPKSETGSPALVASPPANLRTTNGSNRTADANPFDEEEWDEGDAENILVDNGEPGVPVRALYDYDGAESDELTFKQGETFEKLEDEDEQGWCKGRKAGKVGLYPANYVENVPT